MITSDILSLGSRLGFFLLTFASVHRGDLFGLALSVTGFIFMEVFIEDLALTENK